MPTIQINVVSKIARCADKQAYAVCGNSDYVMQFNFDSEWDAYPAKTACFRWNGQQEEMTFAGNECGMPVIYNANMVQIGVYAGDLHTTTPAALPLRKSILCGCPTHAEPTEDVYNQLMALLESDKIKGEQGEPGKDGTNGTDGYSPEATVTETDTGATITITDKSGTTTATVKNGQNGKDGEKGDAFTYEDFTPEQLAALKGEQGEPGKDGKDGTNGTNGKDGADGYSPTATVTATSTGATVTITDKTGTTTAEIKNGEKGADGTDGTDGFSPTATVTQTSTGADISITDKNGTTTATITNGSDANVTKENVVSALGYTPLESAPVTSVNGKTGAVELAASDVGAISDADGSVQNAHLASGAVTTDKLAEGERMTSANIVGALGYEPEEKSGEWELIEEITLTEDTAAIERTQEPDGTAYDFKALLFQATIQPTSVSGANYTLAVLVGCGSKKLAIGYIDNAVSTSSVLTCYGECDEHRGFANFRCANGMSNFGSNTIQRGSSNACLLEPFDSITYFRLRFPVISIPSGSVVKIYAVRS